MEKRLIRWMLHLINLVMCSHFYISAILMDSDAGWEIRVFLMGIVVMVFGVLLIVIEAIVEEIKE